MKNEFDKLNEIENDLDIEEIEMSEEEKDKIRKRIMKKVAKPRKNYKKKMVMAASLCLALGGSLIFIDESVMAAVERIGRSIESFLGAEEVDYKPYKKNIIAEAEDKGIKVNLHEAVLDDDELYISATVDYSKFNIETLAEGGPKKKYSIAPINEGRYVKLNGEPINLESGGATYEHNYEEKKVDILFRLGMENRKTLEGEYDIKLQISEMKVHEEKFNGVREVVNGNWTLGFKIDGKEIAKKREVIKINQQIEGEKGDEKIKITIKEMVKTPISMRLVTVIDKEMEEVFYPSDSEEMYDLEFDFYDQNGESIDFNPSSGKQTEIGYETYEKWMVDKEVTKIEVVPKLTYYDKHGYHNPFKDIKFEEQTIEIHVK